MNIRIFLFFMFFFLFPISIVFSNNIKICVLDTQEILEKSMHARDIQNRLEVEFKPRQEHVMEKQDELKKQHDIFMRDKDILSEKERITQEHELSKMQQDYQRIVQELDVDSRNKEREELIEFNKILEVVLKNLAKQDEIDLIIPTQIILFATETIKITDKVLDNLNKLYNK